MRATTQRKIATVFGGSGFIGRYVVKRLARDGHTVRVAVTDPSAARFLQTQGKVGQIVPLAAGVTDEEAVARAVAGADLVVNLVGILFERRPGDFQRLQAEGAGRVARLSAAAGAERLARQVLGADLAHTVLAVPIAQERATMHLDTVCTMVDVDAVVVYPNAVDQLVAWALTPGADGEPVVSGPEPFLQAAAKAMGMDTLRIIDTGLDPVTAEREQWDDGNNTLAIGPRLCVAYERNVETNAQLERAGIEVIRISGSELGSGRGGPRCMSCPIWRHPLPVG